jgi:hypothetical protein
MYYWPFMPYMSGCLNETVLYLQPTTSSQVTMTSYRNCRSCCPLCSTHISGTKALIYNFLHKVVVYIWIVIFDMHLFLYLKNMSRFLAVHLVIAYTPIWYKIRRHWGPCRWSTATKPHWKFLIQKSTNSASKMWWRSILLPYHTSKFKHLCPRAAQTFTHQKLNSSFIILCGFS